MEGRRMGKGKLFVVRIGKFFSNQRASSSFLMARKASRERMRVFFHVPLARGFSRYSPNRELVSRRLGFPRKYSQLLSLTPPSSVEASLCRRETGEKKKKARGARWKEEREKRGLPLFPSSPSHFLYFDYSIAIFIGIHSGSICGGENSNMGGGTKCPSYRDSTERSKGKQGLNLGVRFSEVSVLYGGVR